MGLKKANPWGLDDMHGNVYEWRRDFYQKTLPGGTSPEVTRTSNTSSLHVSRGGRWANSARFCRAARRDRYAPDYRSYGLGFRPALVQSSQ